MAHNECISDVLRYIESKKHLGLDDMQPEYEGYLRLLRRFTAFTSETRILEIGTGTGWFPILCKRDGLCCKGLEVSRQLVDHAMEFGRQYGIEPDIELGNVEEAGLGEDLYDAIFANSVFEHVSRWRQALENVYGALKPGGMFFFTSTNKFSPTSHEYPVPFYGWLPDRLRYRFRVARQGPDIMELGIDFNQFTHPQLRRAFRQLGFSRVYDRIELVDPQRFASWKRRLLRLAQVSRLIKEPILTFCDATVFVCIK